MDKEEQISKAMKSLVKSRWWSYILEALKEKKDQLAVNIMLKQMVVNWQVMKVDEKQIDYLRQQFADMEWISRLPWQLILPEVEDIKKIKEEDLDWIWDVLKDIY
jgi:hypothetical protein